MVPPANDQAKIRPGEREKRRRNQREQRKLKVKDRQKELEELSEL